MKTVQIIENVHHCSFCDSAIVTAWDYTSLDYPFDNIVVTLVCDNCGNSWDVHYKPIETN